MEETLSVYERICRTRRNGRATALDYITSPELFTDFCELHGDRAFADDHAIVGGIARLHGMPVYFYRKGRGRYRPAQPDTLKAALAAMDSDIRRKPAAVPCCVCFQLKLA